MKMHILRSLALLLCCAAVAFADAGAFSTRIIRPADPAFEYYVPAWHTLRVLNFVQDVQTFTNSSQGGGVLIQPVPAASFKVRLNDATSAIAVRTASFATQSETQKDFVVAGPATVRIEPVTGANVTITFRLAK